MGAVHNAMCNDAGVDAHVDADVRFWDEELEKLRGPLTGYCYRLLGSAADTDDAVQDTLIRVMASRGSFDPRRASLQTWVYRIATNMCLDMLRAAKRRAIPAEPAPGTAAGLDLGEPLAADRWVEPMPDSRML
ncbi:sigma-70 family RNA polymerase sigma factor, partial [Nocardia sp. NPDC046763]|uniref:sigma-70 family RNA polymerase sigma factor n=1 Tax=Nocardia sp. NPDC046763 TaxID=3155256 RepID=UPI0033E4CFDB